MTITNPAFEAKVRRAPAGQFAEKSNDEPTAVLTGARTVQPYEGQTIRHSLGKPSPVEHGHSMAIGEDQVGCVSTFVEEHLLEDGQVLTSVQYVYVAADTDSEDHFRVVTETEQFVSPEPGAYEESARWGRDGSTWERFDGPSIHRSLTRAEADAEQAADEAWLHQAFFVVDQPWTGAPDHRVADDFADAVARLRG